MRQFANALLKKVFLAVFKNLTLPVSRVLYFLNFQTFHASCVRISFLSFYFVGILFTGFKAVKEYG